MSDIDAAMPPYCHYFRHADAMPICRCQHYFAILFRCHAIDYYYAIDADDITLIIAAMLIDAAERFVTYAAADIISLLTL